MNLDPQIRRFVTEVGAAWARYGDLRAVTPVEARRIAEEVRAPWRQGGPEMALITELQQPVRMRVYHPGPLTTKPALVYLHGGGWTLFSIDTHDRLMREYAARAGVVVIGVDYALSPEAKYPVALEQIVAAVRHVQATAGVLNVDPQKIAIGGDSAGGNLALAAALVLRSELRGVLLNYGVFARHSSQEAIDAAGTAGSVLTADEMDGFWRNYIRDENDAKDPLVCPIEADLRGLPPVMLVVPEFDLLAEQSVQLSKRLQQAEVAMRMEIYRGATHSFLEAVSIASIAERALNDSAAWLRSTLA